MTSARREDLKIGDVIHYMGSYWLICEIVDGTPRNFYRCKKLYGNRTEPFILSEVVSRLDPSEVNELKSRLI